MKTVWRDGKIIAYEFTPEDKPPEHNDDESENQLEEQAKSPKDKETDHEQDDSRFFTADDRLKYSPRGHTPGSIFSRDGKIVTNPGLRNTGWVPGDE